MAKSSGFQRRTTPAFELQRDLDLGALAMRIDMDIVVCKFPISPEPDPLLDTSGDFVRFTGRDGKRRKFPRKPIDRQHNLDSEWKRVVFLRGNEIWVNDRRVYTHTAAMWAPEFAPDGKSIRVWSTTWKDGDSQFSVPIQGR